VLASDEPGLVDALLLLSYPLHPPRRPARRRTDHFGALQVPALFVHGSRDPFGSLPELNDARRLIPARTELVGVEGAGHDLARGGPALPLAAVVDAFSRLGRA
jgi:predicted alpha/beta-hydrolase family hydrolase